MRNYTKEQWTAHFNSKSASHFDNKPGYQGDCYERFGCSIHELIESEKIEPKHIQRIKPFAGINEHLIKTGIQHMKRTLYVEGRK